jgi:capsular exopolysaccharide synthesis family protein
MEQTQTKSFEVPEFKLHFLDYWRIIRIRKTVIIAVFLLVAITTTLVTFVLPESYASTVKISVEKDAPDIESMSGRPSALGFDPYFMQTQFEKIQSKLILYQVITNLQLNRKWAEKFKEQGELRTDQTYASLKGMINVEQARNTSLIEIQALSQDRAEAAVIANEIARVYKQSRLNSGAERARQGLHTLEEEMAKLDQTISNQQAKVDKLKIDLGISDIEAARDATTATIEPETLRKLDTEVISVQADYMRARGLFEKLVELPRAELAKAAANAVNDSHLSRLMDDQATLEQKMAAVTNIYTANHPDVKALRDGYATINRQMDERLDGILIGARVRMETERARYETLTNQVALFKNYEIESAVNRRPYFQARDELNNFRHIKDRLYMKIWQEKVDAALPKQGIVEVVEQAEPALRAAKPNKMLNIVMGVIVGLIVGVGLAFFIEYLDTSVKTIDDVERALQAPVLGVIPQNVGTLINEGPDSPHAEAYRVLRTNILFSLKDPKLNTITIVSGGAGEGKSTTIFNLATIFAQNGSRVLVVDSDLRRPSLHKILKLSNSVGLTNYLLKQGSLEDVIQTTALPTLDFLPSGKLPSSSMGVLSSAQMKELIRDLKRRYDYVFFDSPPIMGVSDASILSSEVDCVLQVIQYRRYPQPMTIRAKQMIEKVGGNLLGIVLNNINMSSDENYYYYSGYYYDYYSKSADSEPEKAEAEAGEGRLAGRGDAGAEIKPKY